MSKIYFFIIEKNNLNEEYKRGHGTFEIGYYCNVSLLLKTCKTDSKMAKNFNYYILALVYLRTFIF